METAKSQQGLATLIAEIMDGSSAGPDSVTGGMLDEDKILAVVEGLPDFMGRVVRLYYLEEKSVFEISELASYSQSVVRSNLNIGRHRLRRRLNEIYSKTLDTIKTKAGVANQTHG